MKEENEELAVAEPGLSSTVTPAVGFKSNERKFKSRVSGLKLKLNN